MMLKLSTKITRHILGVIMLAVAFPLIAFAKSPQSLQCHEFKSIINFAQSQHLRFEMVKNINRNQLLEDAATKMSDTLNLMGYYLLSGQFEKSFKNSLIKISRTGDLNQLCKELRSTTYRAAFLKSYMRNLDPYSDFFTTEELDIKTASLDGEFIGVGIGTEPEGDFLRITEVVEGGPSEGKLKVNDIIEKIDGHTVVGLSEMEVRARIRGPLKSAVIFAGTRDGSKFSTKVIRNQIQQRSVSAQWIDGEFLNIKVSRFFRQTAAEVESVLKAHVHKAKGIILDLRNNPGGLLQAARDLVDLFVSQGVVVYLKGKDFEDQVWALRDGGELKIPIVVLVNSATASAAEIVAGALQDYGRAVVVGQHTYGKGSVQNIYETQTSIGTIYKGGLKLTTLWYYLPSGRSVKSLDPDVAVASNMEPLSHPKMPYSGPDEIAVIESISKISSKKINFNKSKILANQSKDSELIGRALLRDMQAIR